MNLTEAIRARRSIRKFQKGAEIPEEHIKAMLEAAMLAPSACNSRPWDFTVVKSEAARREIARVHPYARMVADASIAVVVSARPGLLPKDLPEYWPQDCAAATENLLLQAVALGYGAVWCGVYPQKERVESIRKIIGGDSVPFNVIAVGVPDESPKARGFYDPDRVRII
jgi:nitroreductase